jgi:hypothetical protein
MVSQTCLTMETIEKGAATAVAFCSDVSNRTWQAAQTTVALRLADVSIVDLTRPRRG